MKQLTWQQIYRWRMHRQGLADRFQPGEMIPALQRIVAAQAQVLSAGGLSIGARVNELTAVQVDEALWRDHSVFKIWAMRGTLHLVAGRDLALLTAARAHEMEGDWHKYFEYYGLTSSQYQAFMEAVAAVLTAEPLTRQQLAAAVAGYMHQPELELVFLSSSWGSFWKPCTYAGTLVFGPGQGQHPTFVNPRHLMPKWPQIDPREAHREILRRYLSAYGPSTPGEYAHWWNGGSWTTRARALFREMDGELEQVEVDVQSLFALRGSVDEMADCAQPIGLRLVPLFDEYTFTAPRSLPGAHAPRVYRPQGWISAVVLDDGLIRGIWEYVARPDRVDMMVEFFDPPSSEQINGLELEAARLQVYWGKPVRIIFKGE